MDLEVSKFNCLSVHDHRSIEHTMHTQDGRLWQIDYRRAEQRAEHAAIAYCERAALHVLNGQFVAARLFAKRRNLFLNVRIAHAFHIAHNRHH